MPDAHQLISNHSRCPEQILQSVDEMIFDLNVQLQNSNIDPESIRIWDDRPYRYGVIRDVDAVFQFAKQSGELNRCVMKAIVSNRYMTFAYIMAHLNEYDNWSWDDISRNQSLKTMDVINHPEYNWNFEHLSKNPMLNLSIVQDNMNLPWLFAIMSKNLFHTSPWYIVPSKPCKLK